MLWKIIITTYFISNNSLSCFLRLFAKYRNVSILKCDCLSKYNESRHRTIFTRFILRQFEDFDLDFFIRQYLMARDECEGKINVICFQNRAVIHHEILIWRIMFVMAILTEFDPKCHSFVAFRTFGIFSRHYGITAITTKLHLSTV